MDREQLELRICQYADGTLPADERAALEQTLAIDADARGMLAEHRRLNQQLDQAFALPAVNWDRLAENISAAVAASESGPAIAGRLGSTLTWIRLSAAASVLLAVTAGLLMARHLHRAAAPVPMEMAQRPSDIVIIPQPEKPTGPSIEQITIGPSPALAAQGGDWRYAQGVVASPAQPVVVSRADTRRDAHVVQPPAH